MTQASTSGGGFWTGGRILSAVLLVVVVALAVANWSDVEISFVVTNITLPLSVVIIGVLVVGYVAGWLNRGRGR
jgi:uncharacterized integral membrane protein